MHAPMNRRHFIRAAAPGAVADPGSDERTSLAEESAHRAEERDA